MNMTTKIAALCACGALGTLFRYGAGLLVERAFRGPSWAGTVTVNLLGCFLFGLVGRAASLGTLSDAERLVLQTGFLGAFTTFSALCGDATQLLGTRGVGVLALYVGAQNALGLGALALGAALAKQIAQR